MPRVYIDVMERHTARRAADMLTDLIVAHVSDESEQIDVYEAMAVRDELREIERGSDSVVHKLGVGDILIDDYEPTASPEMNTVEIVGLTGERADEFTIEDIGKTVAECENNKYYPDDDPVVKARYPNMSGDKVWHFPESRLR